MNQRRIQFQGFLIREHPTRIEAHVSYPGKVGTGPARLDTLMAV